MLALLTAWASPGTATGRPCSSDAAGRRSPRRRGVSRSSVSRRRRPSIGVPALERVAVSAGDLFDERLYAYYEDADLASRLRASSYRAHLVTAARSTHAGSASEAALPQSRRALVYGNRYLVVARLLAGPSSHNCRVSGFATSRMPPGVGAAPGRSLRAGGGQSVLLARFAHPDPPQSSRPSFAGCAPRRSCGQLEAGKPPALWNRDPLAQRELLRELIAAWPDEPSFELILVDNCGTAPPTPDWVRRIEPERNLGFAGGANRGVAASDAPYVLVMNPDARPEPGALAAILSAFDEFQDALGIVPALHGPDGTPQHEWQLRPLPTGLQLPAPDPAATECEGAAGGTGPRRSDRSTGRCGSRFEACRASRPRWFRRRLLPGVVRGRPTSPGGIAASGRAFRYEPGARFVHALGATLPRLGYGPFLWIYYRNLQRYLRRHHGRGWLLASKVTLPVGMALRLLLVAVRRPRRAPSRAIAAAGLGPRRSEQ